MRTQRLVGTTGTLAAVGLLAYAALAATAPKPAAPHPAALTYAQDIAPIIYQNCSTCHHAGEVAPFPLMTYADVKKRAKQIAIVTHSRYMPPWKADSHGEFEDERLLTAAQIATLQKWADEGALEGNPADIPPAPHFVSGWHLGQPDAVLEPGKAYTVSAEGNDIYRNFVIPTNFGEDKYISAMEVRPGNRAVVHHIIAYLDDNHQARLLDGKDGQPGYTSTGGGIGVMPTGAIGGWAPGNDPRFLPAGVGTLLPKGADIVLQVHYHKDGKVEHDQTRIALYFAKGPVDKRLRVVPVIYPALYIPTGDSHYTVQTTTPPLPANVTLLQIMPHMHLLGHSMTVSAIFPDGARKQLIDVPNWDFNWQSTYTYKQPIEIPKGARVHMTATYDNSADNPRNPNDPPKLVTWGENTTDEMCIAFAFYTVDSEHLTKGIAADGFPELGRRASRAQLMKLVTQIFDTNGDGKLEDSERTAMLRFLADQAIKRQTARNPGHP